MVATSWSRRRGTARVVHGPEADKLNHLLRAKYIRPEVGLRRPELEPVRLATPNHLELRSR